MKKPICKKWWLCVLVALAVSTGFGGCGSDGDDAGQAQNEADESKDAQGGDMAEGQEDDSGSGNPTGTVVADDGETQGDVTIEEQVLLEQSDVKITAKGMTEDSIWGPAVQVLIENSSAQDVTVQVRNMAVNGIMADPLFSCDVAAGKSANDTITLLNSSLKAAGIDLVQNMEFSFHIVDSDSWETIYDSDMVYLGTSADGTAEQEINADGTRILDQNGISITIQELDSEESFWGADIYVYIENNTEQNVTVQAQSVSINGFMVDPMFSVDIVAGKKAFSSISFLESDLTENGITSIDELEISFHVFDTESWDTIFDSEPVTVSFTE